MLCPICKVELRPMDRQGIEIDYCPQCRGIWLDRGELDKIIERSAMPRSGYGRDERGYDRDDDHDREHGGQGNRGRRREGFLGELFDFG